MQDSTGYDVCVVGAGLVGLATARALSERHPDLSIIVVDKADQVAAHQSSHNSGVIHSGLYYRPGSLKAQLCVEGRDLVYEVCGEHDIPHRRTGKLVIATDPSEIDALDELERRGRANGLEGIERIGPDGIAAVEPAAVGIDALHVQESGIVDYAALATFLAADLEHKGAEIATGRAVTRIDHFAESVIVTAGGSRLRTDLLINCAGLHSDRVAAMAGVTPPVRIVPFRGEYYRMTDRSAHLVRALIYPVPDPRFPFLGVHFTRKIDGTVEVGPNAVPALGREHYRDASIDWADLRETLTFPGFRKLAWRNWRSGTREIIGSRSRRLYARAAQSLVPDVRPDDLLPGGAGVRAQAVTPSGDLVDDFVIETRGSTIHVLNAPSPAATASLAIGRYIATEAEAALRP
jgi:L-2-hydroxyglutarate oxidase LhgO